MVFQNWLPNLFPKKASTVTMTASNTEIVPTTTIVDKPTPITPPFTPTQPITVISTTVYSSTETFHIGDQNIEGFEPLISLCHEILFQVALPVNEFYLELETYGTEAQNPIIVNKSEIAILSPQGIRSPNEWTGTRTVQLPANSLVEGMNILKICAGDVEIEPEFFGDKDDFQIRNIKINIK